MTKPVIVEDANQDDMSRKAGVYVYLDTKLWLEAEALHRLDGPALVSPDGVQRWYVRGREITREVKALFSQNNWPLTQGLDTFEKRATFSNIFAV